jgi:hypothetical protein
VFCSLGSQGRMRSRSRESSKSRPQYRSLELIRLKSIEFIHTNLHPAWEQHWPAGQEPTPWPHWRSSWRAFNDLTSVFAKSLTVAKRAPRLDRIARALRSLGFSPTMVGRPLPDPWALTSGATTATAARAVEKCILNKFVGRIRKLSAVDCR